MVRQARSELTRRKIIASAVDLFSEIGYPAAGLGDVIDRAEMTKGALYYHFDSKAALATAIIVEGGTDVLDTFRTISESSSPALENIIHGAFVVADFLAADKRARVSVQLLRAFGGFNEAAGSIYAAWIDELAVTAARARAEGDIRPDLDPACVAEVILGVLLGAELLSHARSADLREGMTRAWETLLPAIASDDSLDYFREFLSREALRRSPALRSE
ncbi:MAG: TetR/AcrR family transcriptional regulator [Actinobacteria bacterium]|nr:TetR/AcrR family transcriptional regulator [Actinomycetota bacterium]